jgi:hypothetical protein
MVILVVVRRAHCEICHGFFDLDPGSKLPTECRLCGSFDWLYGPESRDQRFIRQGIKKVKKRLNPGATNQKRQARALKQWNRFKTKDGQNV